MNTPEHTEARSKAIAYDINAHLPAEYRDEIFEEDRRFTKNILGAQGKSKRTILIVGGAGYVGSVVTDHLLDAGYAVRSFDNLLYNHGLTVVPFLHRAG